MNHPHICTLHDVGRENGVDFLVMEHLEGETLADRLQRGALRLDGALDIARQIARALDAAHRQGVVHRDLKLGNVMLTKSGVKLLDFGLAKTAALSPSDLSAAPTAQKPLTEKGAILGTFQYMAPEQLEGGEVGREADVFAFGAMLYEMVTGEKAFTGKSQASLIAAILEHEPKPVSELKPTSPASLDRVIQSCLRKDPDERWESARDLERELAWVDTKPAKAATGSLKHAMPLAVAAVMALAFVFVGLANLQPSAPSSPIRVTVNLPTGQRLVYRRNPPIALSPDGSRPVYAADSADGKRQLYIRELSSFESVAVPGTEGAHTPFFSPAGQSLGFVTNADLKKVSLSGGAPMTLAPVRPTAAGGHWSRDGYIYYSPASAQATVLMRISEDGGSPVPISAPMVTSPTQAQSLPDGETVLVDGNASTGGVDIGLLNVATKEIRALDTGVVEPSGAVYAAGYLLVGRPDGSVYSMRFDASQNVVASESARVANVLVMRNGAPYLSVSDTGTLAYVSSEGATRYLVRVDRLGRSTPLLAEFGHAPRLSPDGRRLAYDDTSDI